MRSTDSLWTALVTVSLLEPLTHIVEQEKQRD